MNSNHFFPYDVSTLFYKNMCVTYSRKIIFPVYLYQLTLRPSLTVLFIHDVHAKCVRRSKKINKHMNHSKLRESVVEIIMNRLLWMHNFILFVEEIVDFLILTLIIIRINYALACSLTSINDLRGWFLSLSVIIINLIHPPRVKIDYHVYRH